MTTAARQCLAHSQKRLVTSFRHRPCLPSSGTAVTLLPQCHFQPQQQRFFSMESGEDASSNATPLSPKLQPLYEDITKLSEEEVKVLGDLVLQALVAKSFPVSLERDWTKTPCWRRPPRLLLRARATRTTPKPKPLLASN